MPPYFRVLCRKMPGRSVAVGRRDRQGGCRTGRLLVVVAAFAFQTSLASAASSSYLIVAGDDEPLSVTENIRGLQRDLARLTGSPVDVTTSSALSAEQRSGSNLIVVGSYDRNRLGREVVDEATGNAGDGRGVHAAQSYVVAVRKPAGGAGQIIAAIGRDALGSTYAVSHLRTQLQVRDAILSVGGLTPSSAPSTVHAAYSPSFEERGVYYNLAWNELGALTPTGWNESQWETWIDKLVCCQLTHVYFFLWSDSLDFAKSDVGRRPQNVQLRQRLQQMIRIAHRRGLKVGYHLAPTQIPSDVYQANKSALKADVVYAENGFPVVCSAVPDKLRFNEHEWNGAWDLMVDLYGEQIGHFREADAFQIWFYDPAGCFCGPEAHNCRGLQALRLMEQVDVFSSIARRANPNAQITVSLWPIWALEPMYKVEYRDELLDLLARYAQPAADRPSYLSVADSLTGQTNLPHAVARGLRCNGFFYPTNVETGCCLVVPMLDMCAQAAANAKKYGVQALHHMRIEETTKFANTYLASRFYWNADIQPADALQQYVGWIANSNPEAAQELAEALLLIDGFMCRGADAVDHEADGARIRTLIDTALARLSAESVAELEWLRTTGRAVELIGRAVDHTDPRETLSDEFSRLMLASPAFAASKTPLARYVGWVTKGWTQEHF